MAGTVQISLSAFAGRVLVNAIVEAFGDHTGAVSLIAFRVDVSWMAPEPFAFIFQMLLHGCAQFPARTNAI